MSFSLHEIAQLEERFNAIKQTLVPKDASDGEAALFDFRCQAAVLFEFADESDLPKAEKNLDAAYNALMLIMKKIKIVS